MMVRLLMAMVRVLQVMQRVAVLPVLLMVRVLLVMPLFLGNGDGEFDVSGPLLELLEKPG